MGGVEKHAGNDEGRSRFETERYLLRMGLVAHIGVGLRVEGEVTARDQAKRRARGDEVVEVVEDAQQTG